MTNSERTRLAVFITGLEFFTTSKNKVKLLDKDDEPCIQSNTCFSTLSLPPYKILDNMLQKINYSTMDTSYGRPQDIRSEVRILSKHDRQCKCYTCIPTYNTKALRRGTLQRVPEAYPFFPRTQIFWKQRLYKFRGTIEASLLLCITLTCPEFLASNASMFHVVFIVKD